MYTTSAHPAALPGQPTVQRIEKVLVVTDTWHETNGVTTTLQHTCAVGTRRGYRFAVVHPRLFVNFPNPLYRQYRHPLPAPGEIRDLLQRLCPDAIHLVTEGPLGVCVRRECLRHGWRFTSSFHTRWDQHCKYLMSVPASLVWKWLKWFHSASARVLTPTQSIARLLRDQGFHRPIGLWQRGIDERLFYPRVKTHREVERPVLLYVGRISREKNLPAFLDLHVPGTKYVVGDGPLLAKLRQCYHEQIAAGRIVFFGEKRGRELAELYTEADLFVFPSQTETFGNVILEALASGVPVAAYPAPGPMDILTDRRVGVLHHKLDCAVREALACGQADACVAFARRYTWDSATAQFLQALVPAGTASSMASWPAGNGYCRLPERLLGLALGR